MLPIIIDASPIIKHDLDLRIEDEQGNVYYPYKLDPLSPSSAATTDTKNFVDNVEKVYIENPTAGTYTIIVNHEGTLSPNQVFSIVLSGLDEFSGVPECSSGLTSPANGSVDAFLNHLITWTPASFASSYDIYFGTDGNGTSVPSNIMNGESIALNSFRYNMEPLTTYYLMILPRNSSGVNDACSTIYSFTTMPAVSQYPYFEGAEDVVTPAMPEYWQGLNYGTMQWASTNLLGNTGTNSFACYTTNGSAAPLDNYLISPPFMVEPGKEYMLSYAYRGFVPSSPESLRVLWGTDADTLALTNLIYADPANASVNWIEKEHLLVPEYDGHIFFAWHANTASGMGQFIDDVMIEDWGLVGVKESAERQVRVTYQQGKIVVNSQFALENANLTVVNTNGQTIMSKTVSGLTEEFSLNLSSGYYVIKLQGSNLNKTTWVFIP
jgi:hypothetical protein